MSKQTQATPLQEALAHLSRLQRQRPTLAAPVQLLQDLLPRLFSAATSPPPHLDEIVVREKLAAGMPMLRGETSLDLTGLESLCEVVCTVGRKQNPSAASVAQKLGDLRVQDLLIEVLSGRPQSVHDRAADLGLDVALAGTILRLAALPILSRWAEALGALQREPWDQGYCPFCGSAPLLGEFRGLEQNRFLRCGWCASDWAFARLRCPHCDNRDHRRLGFLQVEGEETRCRAATCEECRGYVKMVFTLEAPAAPMLLVHDLGTVHLDLAAAERGYVIA